MSNVRRKTISVLYKQQLIDRPLNPHSFISAITVQCLNSAVKPVLRGHSKIDKTMVLTPFGILMQIKSTAECIRNTFDLH